MINFLNIILFILNILLLFCITDTTASKALNWLFKHGKDISSVLVPIIGLTNLFLVIRFFTINKKDKVLEEQEKKIAFWYRDVILKPNFEKIEDYFSVVSSLCDDLSSANDDEEYSILFLNVKETSTNLVQDFNNLVKVLDEELGEKLDLYLEKIEDLIVEYGQEVMVADDKKEVVRKLQNTISIEKKNFLKTLYTYEFSNYKILQVKDNIFQSLVNKIKSINFFK